MGEYKFNKYEKGFRDAMTVALRRAGDADATVDVLIAYFEECLVHETGEED